MIPPEFTNFFLASAGAAAALIGLLFVAVSIAPEHTVMEGAPLERQAVAAGSFTALINAFFISLGALIPGITLGGITLAMSLVGTSSSLSMAWVLLLRHRSNWLHTLRRVFMVAASLTLYGYELYDAVLLLKAPSLVPLVYSIAVLLLFIYGVALIRAWELLGARRFGFLNWLNPVRDTNDREVMAKPDQSTFEKKP